MKKSSKTKQRITVNLMYKLISSLSFIAVIIVAGVIGLADISTPEPNSSASISHSTYSVSKSNISSFLYSPQTSAILTPVHSIITPTSTSEHVTTPIYSVVCSSTPYIPESSSSSLIISSSTVTVSSSTPNPTQTYTVIKTPLSTPMPTVSSAPKVTPTPSISFTPTATPKPATSSTPKATPTPSVSFTPKATVKPTVSSIPEVTPIPSISSAPKVTPTPSVTTLPTPTVVPSINVIPSPTISLNNTYVAGDPIIHFIPSNGDATLITDSTLSILIDTGENHFSVYNYLVECEITHLDYIILTNLATYHTGGLAKILQNIDVDKIILFHVDNEYNTPYLVNTLKKFNGVIEYIEFDDVGKTYDICGWQFEILTPLVVKYADSLQLYSMAIKFVYKETSILFMSDVSSENEELLLQSCKNLSSDIIKISNHACNGYTNDALLTASAPKLAIITPLVEQNGIMKYDITDTIALLDKNGIPYLNVNESKLILTSDGTNMTVKQ